jgi:hypothetical protein
MRRDRAQKVLDALYQKDGEQGTYTVTANSMTFTVLAIMASPDEVVGDDANFGVVAPARRATVRVSDLPDVTPTPGDSLSSGGTVYPVTGSRIDDDHRLLWTLELGPPT